MRIDFDACLSTGRECSLCSFTCSTQTSHSTLVVTDVLLELPLEFLNVVVDHSVVEVLTTKMSVSSCGFYFKNTIFNSKDGHIKGSTTKIKDQNIPFTTNLFVQTIGNGGSCRFVNDSENIKTRDSTGIFSGLTL